MVLLAQITDLHIDGSERAAERLTRTMDLLRGLATRPDALLVTGDIANSGLAAEYAEAAGLLEAPFPVYLCPGNHDTRPAFREGLLGQSPADGPINQLHLVQDGDGQGSVAVLLADSVVPGIDGGRLDPETLQWIEDGLGALEPNTPAVLAFHHPPARIGHPMLDSMLLDNPDELAALLGRHPEVVGVVNGHTHVAAAAVFAGRPLVYGPAVESILTLPFQHGPKVDTDSAPGVAFHLVTAGRMVTHFRSVW